MGLTVHWKLQYEGSRKSVADLFDKLAEVINSTSFSGKQKSPFYISDGHCSQPISDEELNWILFLADKNKSDPPIHPEEIFSVCGDPGEGSEKANFFLARYPGEEKWEGFGFCKTQYAKHFVESHVLLIEWLDVLRDEGVETEVFDEGDYWKTRDIAKLLGQYENFNTALGMLSEEMEKRGIKVTGAAPDYNKRRKHRLN